MVSQNMYCSLEAKDNVTELVRFCVVFPTMQMSLHKSFCSVSPLIPPAPVLPYNPNSMLSKYLAQVKNAVLLAMKFFLCAKHSVLYIDLNLSIFNMTF